MRSLVLLGLVAAATVYGVVKTLPEREAGADPRPGRPQEVQSVALDGRGLPIAALRAVMTTHAGELVETGKLDADRTALEHVLVTRGYLDAKVSPAHVSYDSFGAAYVTFDIEQGPLFHVRSITVTGAADKDTGVVTLAKGEAVDGDRIERARAALSDRLAARGKHVEVDAKLSTVGAAVDIELSAH